MQKICGYCDKTYIWSKEFHQCCSTYCKFWSKVKIINDEDSCWEWQNASSTKGYGVFRLNGIMKNASRAAWEITYGILSKDTWVLHRCDNPRCTRLCHLFLGSASDNNKDCIIKNRHNRPKGEKWYKGNRKNMIGEGHYAAVLTKQDIIDIRNDNSSTNADLAKKYNTSKTNITLIKQRLRWKHV